MTENQFISKLLADVKMELKREIVLDSQLESVEKAAAAADAFVSDAGFDAEFGYSVDMAVRESVANAIKHGNKLDAAKNVEMKFSADDEALTISVRDHGDGFAVEDIPDPTNPENLLKVNGRGILFMNSFMDEVNWARHEDGGMIVSMKKRR
ncbi:MAG TPA: ATP-binding protein [Pyrinomonadaceae bacterium]|nr:ATP-binding protein [Pyrinomonadaceae bacterium]